MSTGNDEKNLLGLRSYPPEVQQVIRSSEKYRNRVRPVNKIRVFISNLLLFLVILFIFGLVIRADSFAENFFHVLAVGESLNLFDLVVIDLIWWRSTKRIRFSDIPEKQAYQNPKEHIDSFVRGAGMYLLAALIDGALLTIPFGG